MKLFDGKKHARLLENKISEFMEQHEANGSIAIIQIGENKASEKYVGIKKRVCSRLEIPVKFVKISSDIPTDRALEIVGEVVSDELIGSVIVQLPLPRDDLSETLNIIPGDKDVDFLSEISRERFFGGDLSKLPPVVRAVEYFNKVNGIDVKGKKCTVLGRGFLVGAPVAHYLKSLGGDVVVLNSKNFNEKNILEAEFLVLSSGKENIITGEQITEGADVIDFGYPGDLDMSSTLNHLNNVSPSIGGMGPLVVRFLIMNHLGI